MIIIQTIPYDMDRAVLINKYVTNYYIDCRKYFHTT
jgi:hypothetical protein